MITTGNNESVKLTVIDFGEAISTTILKQQSANGKKHNRKYLFHNCGTGGYRAPEIMEKYE